MISKNELQYYSSLLKKKYRKQENKFIVEGKKSVLEGLGSSYKCKVVFLTQKFIEENKEFVDEIKTSKTNIITLNQKEALKLSDTKTPQGITAVFINPKLNKSQLSSINDKLIVMLDNISDPGNLGTIIRNCDWFGINNIILSENIADYTNSKVIRASMGSIFHVNIYKEIKTEMLLKLKERGYEILCANLEGENIFTYKSEKKKILVLSSESHGPSEEIERMSDKKICIPKIGDAESLNVASASAVLLAQLTK